MPEKDDMLYDLITEMRAEQREFRKELRQDMGDFRGEIREQVKASCSSLGRLEQRMGHLELQLSAVSGDLKTISAMFNGHCADANLHYNPYYGESNWQKIKRKKVEIGAGVSASSIIATVIYILIQKFVGG